MFVHWTVNGLKKMRFTSAYYNGAEPCIARDYA